MAAFSLLAVGFLIKAVAVLFVMSAVMLILLILIQKGRGGGLSAAFGGGMASGILGTKTGDFLTWVTIVLVGLFLTFAVVMAKFYRPTISDFGEGSRIRQKQPQPTGQPPSGVPRRDSNSAGGAGLPGMR